MALDERHVVEGGEWTALRLAGKSPEALPGETVSIQAGITRTGGDFGGKLLIVDDHPLFRAALEGLIRAISPAASVTLAQLVQESEAYLANGRQFDCIFLDLDLPDAKQLEGLNRMRQAAPKTPIIVVSGMGGGVTDWACRQAGAHDVLSKTVRQDEMIAFLQRNLRLLAMMSNSGKGSDSAKDSLSGLGLTDRQRQVAQLVSQARSNAYIAQELGIKLGTVKSHITVIMRVLGVRSRAEAIAMLLSDRRPDG